MTATSLSLGQRQLLSRVSWPLLHAITTRTSHFRPHIGHLKRFGAVGAETDENWNCAASEDLNNKQSIYEMLLEPDGDRVGHGLPWVFARHYSTYLSFQTLARPP